MLDEKDIFSRDKTSTESATIFVSLYLFILIFFILLNSVTKNNEASAVKVVASIEKVFSLKKHKTSDIIPLTAEKKFEMLSIVKLYFVKNIKNSIDEDFDIVDNELYDKTNILKMEVSTTSIFPDNEYVVRKDKNIIFKRMADIINKSSDSEKLFLEVTLTRPSSTIFYGKFRNANLSVNRLVSLRKSLLSAGIEESKMQVGSFVDAPPKITFSFYFDDRKLSDKQIKEITTKVFSP